MTGGKGLILVVDDELLNREVLSAMLRPMGYEVDTAENGRQALQKVKDNPPDLVLLDVMMPDMDGFEVVKRLSRDDATKPIPVVMVTALSQVQDRITALEAGANDFLSKPVDRAELQATVHSQMQIKAYHDFMKSYQEKLEAEVARRTKEVSDALDKLEDASLDTIMRLSRAAEYKDEDTGSHIMRMSQYASSIALELGLGEKVAQHIQYAAPMHDVGKIGIPDHVLTKPGKLDADEWEIMKRHTTIGANILGGAEVGFLKLAEVIALTHHERWDGTGYPRGLKGNAIPLAGRITALADVFDALLSKRPYKEPFPMDKALAIIKSERGKQFEPVVVDGFFRIQDQVITIMKKYVDPV